MPAESKSSSNIQRKKIKRKQYLSLCESARQKVNSERYRRREGWTRQWLMFIPFKVKFKMHKSLKTTTLDEQRACNSRTTPLRAHQQNFDSSEVCQNGETIDRCRYSTGSFVKDPMSKSGRRLQVLGVKEADERANKRAGGQAKMDDGWCWYRRKQPRFI